MIRALAALALDATLADGAPGQPTDRKETFA